MYVATKAALEAFTIIAAKELGPRGIRVNGIAPGPSDTEGTRASGFVGYAMETASVSPTPLGRSGRPDDYGPGAVFLASDSAHWVTGDVILVSGGTALTSRAVVSCFRRRTAQTLGRRGEFSSVVDVYRWRAGEDGYEGPAHPRLRLRLRLGGC
jgi:hypothetical protein